MDRGLQNPIKIEFYKTTERSTSGSSFDFKETDVSLGKVRVSMEESAVSHAHFGLIEDHSKEGSRRLFQEWLRVKTPQVPW